MMILAIDPGKRRTGVAFADRANGVPIALDTIHHATMEELTEKIDALCRERRIDQIVIGLPLLPGGNEGEQSGYARSFARGLSERGWATLMLDERYTTSAHSEIDGDAAAAVSLLHTHLERLLTKEKNDIN